MLYNEKLENVIIDNQSCFRDFADDRKFITTDTVCAIYKPTMHPVIDYGDSMIESAPKTCFDRLERLKEIALIHINNRRHCIMNVDIYKLYKIQPLIVHRKEHIACIMYRQEYDPFES